MAFNLDHTAGGNLDLAGSYIAFTGSFSFPKPAVAGSCVTLITQEAAYISSISGLQSCIDLLVETSGIGTASTLNADNSACNAMLVNQNNLINISNLPDAIKSCVFVVANSGQLTLLDAAKKGSVAITSNTYMTFVLSGGLFNNISNWVPLLNPDNCIDSVNLKTGQVFISGVDLDSLAGYGSDVESAVEFLSTGYTDSTYLTTNYVTEADFNDDVIPYETTSSLTNALLSYATTGCVSNCLSFYTDNNGTGALFAAYALEATFGTASESQHNVGTAGSCVLCVGVSGFIDSSVLPDPTLVETFIISTPSGLTGLSTATIGDVAFDTVNHFNYILINSGVDAYQTSANWCRLSAEEGALLNVNNHTADGSCLVSIYSNDVCLGIPTGSETYLSVSDTVILLDNAIFGVEDDYRSSGSFDSNRDNYVLTSVFDYIASGKSVTGHSHPITGITDLDSCLTNISPFEEANTINLDKSYSYKLGDTNTTVSCGSLIVGEYGKAKNNYSLVQSPGKFAENGDAQYSSVAGKVSGNNSWTTVINVELDNNSIALINADFVSRNCDSFRLEGAVARENGNVLFPEEMAKAIYHTGNVDHDVRICAGASAFVLQVKGNTYWTSSLEMVSTKMSGMAGPDGIGLYWQGLDDSNWFNVSGNWFTENTFTDHATSLPSGASNVQMVGSVVPVANLDCASWVQPNSIDTTAITNPNGICFVSTGAAVFSGQIYGNAEFFGVDFA
jgi:hypothetical protein